MPPYPNRFASAVNTKGDNSPQCKTASIRKVTRSAPERASGKIGGSILRGRPAADLRASVCRLDGGAARRAGKGEGRPPRARLAAAEGEARRLAVGAGLAAFAMGRKGDAIQEDLSVRFCVAFSVD